MSKTRALIAASTLALLSACAGLPGSKAEDTVVQTATTPARAAFDDPFLWMEEVLGERALTWVRAQNERTLGILEGDPRFAGLQEDALAIIRATDRLTFGGYADGYVSNFWQDTSHVRGIWRRATFDSWKSGNPQWETVLDYDQLAAAEGKNWVAARHVLIRTIPGTRCACCRCRTAARMLPWSGNGM